MEDLMGKLQLLLVTVLIGICMTTSAFCADVAKIGTFNIQKIISESSAGKLVQKELRAKFSDLQDKLKNEGQQIEEMKKAIEREALVLSAEKSNEKQREFRIRVNDFKKMQKDSAQEFKELENKYKDKLVKEIYNIVNALGKEEGFLIILDEQNAGVFYKQDHLDITDKIIKKYNQETAKTPKS